MQVQSETAREKMPASPRQTQVTREQTASVGLERGAQQPATIQQSQIKNLQRWLDLSA